MGKESKRENERTLLDVKIYKKIEGIFLHKYERKEYK